MGVGGGGGGGGGGGSQNLPIMFWVTLEHTCTVSPLQHSELKYVSSSSIGDFQM